MRLVFIVFVIAVLLAGACPAQRDSCDNLNQGVRAAEPAYELGECITLEFAIRNTGSTTMIFEFPSAKQFDIWITRGDGDFFRASHGRAYARTQTSIALRPGETRRFTTTWDQRDMITGKQVGPGIYHIYAQLTPSGKNPPPVTTGKVQIGMASAALVPITVREAITNVTQLLGRRTMIVATYRGKAPESDGGNTKTGPPVTPNDWAICDATGCMYVTGDITLDPVTDTGARITVVGRIAVTEQGEVYMILQNATTSRGSVCPR